MKKAKMAAAVELGRLGGLKGGPARAKKLSTKRRQEIARHAAQVRWAAIKEINNEGFGKEDGNRTKWHRH